MAVAPPIILPELTWKATEAKSSRNGARVRLAVVHRWGARGFDVPDGTEAISFGGVINEFENPANQASAHFVGPIFEGGKWKATQMVAYADKAWTESFYNPVSVEIESPDNLWVGAERSGDIQGLHVLARMVAYWLHRYGLPPVYVDAAHAAAGAHGFCRHADLGSAGGGHTQCPTTNMQLWHLFVALVQHEHTRGGFRKEYGR